MGLLSEVNRQALRCRYYRRIIAMIAASGRSSKPFRPYQLYIPGFWAVLPFLRQEDLFELACLVDVIIRRTYVRVPEIWLDVEADLLALL